ncbi:hypothetical protein [Falsirhodobacter sp. 20TX0035]|uniref:hypothetical protein n=1 Tax=Falsirhodobacter sp. 20TX0035 TaxID=3022019 RepID=UPI00232D9243|nr:hypothetical protein [Falsirhodobacter sp. 20TX0035]MDB6454277.1 hypothetical protein [Falsirhodobacter sp. 20TX0035]
MMWWVGTQEAVSAAERAAAARVVGQPEFIDGVEVAPEDRVTQRWAFLMPTASGEWAIPAHPDLKPAGVALVAAVEWPAEDEA